MSAKRKNRMASSKIMILLLLLAVGSIAVWQIIAKKSHAKPNSRVTVTSVPESSSKFSHDDVRQFMHQDNEGWEHITPQLTTYQQTISALGTPYHDIDCVTNSMIYKEVTVRCAEGMKILLYERLDGENIYSSVFTDRQVVTYIDRGQVFGESNISVPQFVDRFGLPEDVMFADRKDWGYADNALLYCKQGIIVFGTFYADEFISYIRYFQPMEPGSCKEFFDEDVLSHDPCKGCDDTIRRDPWGYTNPTRVLMTQRLELAETTSLPDIETYIDCDLISVGMGKQEVLDALAVLEPRIKNEHEDSRDRIVVTFDKYPLGAKLYVFNNDVLVLKMLPIPDSDEIFSLPPRCNDG